MGAALKENEYIEESQPSLQLSPRRLGRTELQVSPICFGSLRLTPQNGIYKETLHRALKGGIRFIDTSGSYGNGASEIVIGEVLREFAHEHPEEQKDIVLCTKFGPIQGAILQEIQQREAMGQKISGLHKVSERMSYCLSPEYLEHQLSLSLRRLQRETVDLILLQNPECLFQSMNSKEEFMQYLKRAFEHLEVEVVRGRIKHYGISSSSFLKKEISQDFLSIDELYELANSISKNHHFSVIQCPFNLFETNALFIKNQKGKTVFEKVEEYDLGLLACRPLTSHHRDKVHHFITFPGKDDVSVKGKLHKTLLEVVEMEKDLFDKMPEHNELKWGHLLRGHLNNISDWWKWSVYLQKQILPSLQQCIERLPHTEEWNRWKIHYVNKVHSLFSLITDSLQGIANLRTNQICHYLNKGCKDLEGETKLSNKVTRLYLSVPGIHSIVMGLSDPQHIDDLLAMGTIPSFETTKKVFKDVKMQF